MDKRLIIQTIVRPDCKLIAIDNSDYYSLGDDMINFIIGKRGEISKERLVVFLKVIGWPPSRINKAFKELKCFCRGY